MSDWWKTTRGRVQVKELTYDEEQADDLLTLFKLHARIEDSTQDDLLLLFLRSAVTAAENYTNRDFYYKHYKLLVGETEDRMRSAIDYEFRRGGNYSGLSIKDGAGQDLTSVLPVDEFKGPKGTGFRVCFQHGYEPYTLEFNSGYEDFESLPSNVKAFVFQVAAAQYEVREVINYTAMVQSADMLPVYLLSDWRIAGFA